MGNWKKQKYKRKTVRPKRISHRQIAETSNQSNKYMRLDSKNLYTSLINKIDYMDISKIEISSGKEIHSSVRCSIHEAYYYIAIKTPTDNKVEFIHNLVKAWNEEKKARKNISDYEMLLYLSFNEKSSPINEFRKIPLSKSKKLRVFYTLSLEECHKLSNNYYAALGDLIPIIFPWIQEDPGDDGTAYWSDDESDGNRGGGKPKYGFAEGFGYWRPGPGLVAAKMPPKEIRDGIFGDTGLNIYRNAYVDPKDFIKDGIHGKRPKGKYVGTAVIIKDDKKQDESIQANIPVHKIPTPLLSEILHVHGECVKVQVDKPIESSEYTKAFMEQIESNRYALACRKKNAKKNSGTISGKAGAGNDRKEGHPITCKVTVDLKDDSLDKNKKTKGGQRTTQRRRASSVPASGKESKRSKLKTGIHSRRKKNT